MYKLIPALVALLFACKPMAPQAPSAYDDEFLYWCKAEGRWGVYTEYPEDCETEVSRGEWDHLPITVNAETSLEQEVMQAVESFNSQVGFELFRFQTLNMDPDIGVMELKSLIPWAAAEARHFGLGDEQSGLVVVQPSVAVMDRDEIMLHELGHMVGLRHDPDNLGSVMYPGPSIKSSALEHRDVMALRARYRHLIR